MPVQPEVSFRAGCALLRGRVFLPKLRAPRAIVVLNGATGVPARYYDGFAAWLAESRDIACLTYDYRDFGKSARGHARRSSATMTDWGVHDQQAARDFAVSHFPDVPLWIIGHSLGGLCLPFQRNLDQIDRVITVGSGAVHVCDHPWPYQALARVFWSSPILGLAEVLGFLPGRALRLGPDLPLGVYRQWRRWCTRKDFVHSDIGRHLPWPDWRALTAPMKFVAMSDDALVPPAAVWRLMQLYPEAWKTQAVLRPETYGVPKLGHIAVFDPKHRAVWPDIIA